MKKVLALALVLVIALSAFVGCAKPIDWENTYLAPSDYANEDWDNKEIAYQFWLTDESAGNGTLVVNLYKDGSVVGWQGSTLSQDVFDPITGTTYKPSDVPIIFEEYKIFQQIVGYYKNEDGKLTINVFLYDDDEEYKVVLGEIDENGKGSITGFPTRSCVVKYEMAVDVFSDGTVTAKNRAEFFDTYKSVWGK